jgi:hypothetical protein
MPQKTVYFLGAGASAASDFKLPEMKGFFKEKDFPKKGGEYPNLNEFLKTFYKSSDWGNFNLEEIITHLELTMEGFNWGLADTTLLIIKKDLYKYIKTRLEKPLERIYTDRKPVDKKNFPNDNNKDKDVLQRLLENKIVDNDGSNSDYVYFNKEIQNKADLESRLQQIEIRRIKPITDIWLKSLSNCQNFLKLIKNITSDNDSIITLNYDLIIDKILLVLANTCTDNFNSFLERSDRIIQWHNVWGGVSLSQYPSEKEKGAYIKLHGSIDWTYCPSQDCPHHWIFSKFNPVGEPCSSCGTSLETVIVPPTMKKSFEKFPKLGFLWHVAFKKLKEADKIIVIGMSFPDSDYYLKWLVRQAMIERRKKDNSLPELIIVNKKPEDAEDSEKIFRNTIKRTEDIFGLPCKEPFDGLDNYLNNNPEPKIENN